MAQPAKIESQRAEIQRMAQYIVRDQRREVEQVPGWKQQWFAE